jgi:hypothetical protein
MSGAPQRNSYSFIDEIHGNPASAGARLLLSGLVLSWLGQMSGESAAEMAPLSLPADRAVGAKLPGRQSLETISC